MACDPIEIIVTETTPVIEVAALSTTDAVDIAVGEVSGPPGPTGPKGDPGTPEFSAQNSSGSTIEAGLAVAMNLAGTEFVRADNQSAATTAVGLASADAANGFSLVAAIGDVLELGDWTAATGAASLPARSRWYLGQNGLITQSPSASSGTYVQFIGEAVGPQKLHIQIDRPIRRS